MDLVCLGQHGLLFWLAAPHAEPSLRFTQSNSTPAFAVDPTRYMCFFLTKHTSLCRFRLIELASYVSFHRSFSWFSTLWKNLLRSLLVYPMYVRETFYLSLIRDFHLTISVHKSFLNLIFHSSFHSSYLFFHFSLFTLHSHCTFHSSLSTFRP